MISAEGASDRSAVDASAEATAVVAARVAAAREGGEAAHGDEVVRRYVLSTQPLVRDLGSGRKVALDRVLDGELDEFVAHRLGGGREPTPSLPD
jgi:hypothetical protein